MPGPGRVTGVRVGYRSDGVWVDGPTPHLGWRTESEAHGWCQIGADVELRRDGQTETTRIEGTDSTHVAWPFRPLTPRETVSIRVRSYGADGTVTAWSEATTVRAAHLAPGEWDAAMLHGPSPSKRPLHLRREFDVPGPVRRATLYSTSRGVHQTFVNGVEVDDERLKPGWTSYRHRLQYDTNDVTGLLAAGPNAVGIHAAGGWYTERYGFADSAQEVYGHAIAAAVLLVVELEDGRILRMATDSSWRATDSGPLTSSGIYAGESYDARREMPGWASAHFDDGAWDPASVADPSATPVPTPRIGPPVRATQELGAVSITPRSHGRWIVDFGQNIVGHVRIRVSGSTGETITLRHAEVLEDGELSLRPLRAAEATDRYVLKGGASEEWEPRFTFHGFRYVEVSGWPGELRTEDLTGVVVHSDMRRTGWFESSDARLNRLHENVLWSMRGNFLSIPSDCPQRDERLGWTGDIQVFAPTASFLYDCNGFLASWLTDLRLEQHAGAGHPPHVVPDVLGEASPAAGWGDAATVVPSVLHDRFGDLELLRDQYPSMTSWTDVMLARAGESALVSDGFQFGDWLDPDAPAENPGKAKTDKDLVATAYLFRSTELAARAAELLDRPDDASRYRAAALRVKRAFLAEYVSPNGRLVSDTVTAYSLAITNGLYTDDLQRAAMGARLAHLVRATGYRITTGFLGTPIVADALSSTGHLREAGRLLTQEELPSWLYPVSMGATTIWERWDSLLADGSVNPGSMTSFNHYALGAIADWMHRVLAGIAPLAPAYRRIAIAPRPIAQLTHARARFDSPHGEIEAGWQKSGDRLTVTARIPANTTAVVALPDGSDPFEVGSGDHSWTVPAPTEPPPQPLTLASSLAQVIDDPAAYRALIDGFARWAPADLDTFRLHNSWTPGNRLAEALNRAPLDLVADVEERFAKLNAEREVGDPQEEAGEDRTAASSTASPPSSV